jgi:alpha-tubulin suppressor-like RCC1 family protein
VHDVRTLPSLRVQRRNGRRLRRSGATLAALLLLAAACAIAVQPPPPSAATAATPTVSLETSFTTVSVGAHVFLSGTVTQPREGATTVTVLRRTGGRWKTDATADIAADGTFTAEVVAGKAGTIELLAQYKAGKLKVRSPVLSVKAIAAPLTWSAVSAAARGTAAIAGDGTLWTWGANGRGQLGQGFTDEDAHSTPSIVSTDAAWATVSAGADHTLALKDDGTLWAWGANQDGQLGLGETTATVTRPTQVGADADWSAVASGRGFSLALKEDGTLWAWGANPNGQLGQGDGTSRRAPARVGRDGDWLALAAGRNHAMALKKDGSLWGWGFNGNGQLGTGDTRARPAPARVIGDTTTWKAVSCGDGFTLAVSSAGALFGWGYNGDGQLGVGDAGQRLVPAQVGVRTTWTAVSCGSHHALCLRRDGTLWAFGWNGLGQLGIGSTEERQAPAQVGADADWMTVSAGGESSFGLKQDGALWSWGGDESGQVGVGDTESRDTPTLVGPGSR